MKHLLPIIFISASFLFSAGTLLAQDELDIFQEAAGDVSVLFRGKQATRYTFAYNGNPYWERPDFHRGDLFFEGNLYRNFLLNVDAREQRVLVRKSSGITAVSLTPLQTPSFTIGDRHFVGIGPGEALAEGFYEVFGTGEEQVYKHVEKVLNEAVADMNGSAIGYYDPGYRSDVYRYFAIKTTYYFRNAEGEFSRIRSRGSLLRKFPSNSRKEIRRAVKAAGIGSSKDQFDDYCKAVLNAAAR